MNANHQTTDLPDEFHKLLDQCYTSEEEGNLEEALHLCKSALQIAPRSAEAHNLRGIILEQLDQQEDAIASYSQAIRLDPDFDEARQNLIELQSEILTLGRKLSLNYAMRNALQGAIGFGISFAILSVAIAAIRYLQMTTLNPVQSAASVVSFVQPNYWLSGASDAVLYAVSIGAGAYFIVRTIKPGNIRLFVALVGLGSGVACFLTGFLELWLPRFLLQNGLSLNPAFVVSAAIRFTLVGVCTGAILGTIRNNWKQIILLSWVGAIAFGIYGLLMLPSFHLALLIDPFIPGIFGNPLHNSITFGIVSTVQGALGGCIAGALLGAALRGTLPTPVPPTDELTQVLEP